MVLKKSLILSGLAVVIIAATQIVLAQDLAPEPSQPELITSSQESSAPKEGDLQWAWGELVNLDSSAQTFTLKYLDYETDQEKELVLAVDGKTTFENIKDFSELKVKDTLSIDYVIGADNLNIAKNISLERTEDDLVLAPAEALPVAVTDSVPAEPAIVPAVDPASAEPVATEATAVTVATEPAPEAPPEVQAAAVAPDQAQ